MKAIKSDSNFEAIREYVCADDQSKLTLNETQKNLLRRWNYYISLRLAGELKTREIVARMMEEFNIERATVFNDMGNSEALFGYSSTIDKRFRIGARIDFLEEKINYMYSAEVLDFYTASRLEAVLQRYYDIYPDIKKSSVARTINFNFTKNEFNMDELPELQDAIEILDKNMPA